MPAVLNTNMASLYAQKNLSTAQTDLATSVQRLSSGKRINSAKDDAAGFAVAEAVAATKNITDQSIRNAQDAISLVQTAEGALDVVGKVLQRALTLVSQRENSTLTAAQKGSINAEIKSLFAEVADIKERTKFQGGSSSIFSATAMSFRTGDNVTTSVPIGDLTLNSLFANSAVADTKSFNGSTNADATSDLISIASHGYTTGDMVMFAGPPTGSAPTGLTAGSVYYVIASSAGTFKLATTYENALAGTAVDITAVGSNATNTIYRINSDSTVASVQTNLQQRSGLGTWQTRLNYIVDNMQTLSNNLADAQSRIVDTDYAAETAALTRGQILQQAATSMLAQANQMPNVILTLLK